MIVIKRVGVLQLAKILGVLYLLLTAIFCLPAGVFMMLIGGFQGQEQGFIGGIGMFLLPVLYGVGGFIGGAITAALYNVVASLVGGIELELQQ